jgi:hypothetical protein
MNPSSPQNSTVRSAAVVALHKCGINLFSQVVGALGGRVVGAGVRSSYADLAGQMRARWGGLSGDDTVDEAEWLMRYPDRLLALLPEQVEGTCMSLHSLPASVLAECRLPDMPTRWFFLVRDPRARLVSLIGYLAGMAREAPSRTTWTERHRTALAGCATDDERVRYAMEALPGYTAQYRTHAWLLDHPGVRVVRFEDLVGAAGGGDDARQQWVWRHIAGDLACGSGPVPGMFRAGHGESRTFRKGRIDEWPRWFSAENHRLFLELYGDVLARYGYPDEVGKWNGPNHSV